MKSVSRLVQAFTPAHYTLSTTINRPERTFSGVVTIEGQALADSNEIRLHAKDLTIHRALIDGKVATTRLEPHDELVLEQNNITAGKHIIVVEYAGIITDSMNGIYPGYFEVNGEKQELIGTQFESHYARQAFPVIDEPEAKATFAITLTTEKNVTVLSNMPVIQQTEQEEHLVTTFATTPRMSSYLVAWVIGDLQKKSATTNNGVEVNIWATKAHDPSNLDFALDIATRTIEFFDEYFGVPYPLPKADHVALPDFSAGAMENWGLITYREIALLVDPKNTSLSTKQYAATVIAHELSHQWFGNLVTMKWWNDLWLNESFANMMEYVAIDAIEPRWNVWLDHASSEVVSALRRDSLDGVQAIQTAVHFPEEIQTIFDPSIVYAKGSRLLRMLQAYLGDDAMRRGLKDYFETYMYQNTVADNLWDILGVASGKDVAGMMHAWMTQPGFPIVTATQEGTEITLTQKQFFVGPYVDEQRLWPIPLHATSTEVPELFKEATVSFHYHDTKPFYLNNGSTAHFITHYDEPLMANILVNIDELSTINRLQLIHEQTLLVQAGIVPAASLLPLIASFTHETEEAVWSVLAIAINELKRFVETDEIAEKQLRAFVGRVVTPLYENLGWEARPNETENDTKLRGLAISLALYGEIPDALAKAAYLYETTPVAALNSELRAQILGNAVRSTPDQTVVDALIAEYKKATHSELRDDIAAALTSTKDPETVKKLAALSKDSAIVRPQDFTHWFVWLLRNRHGRDYMWQWAQDEWPWLKKTFSGDSSYDMFPRYIASSLVTAAQALEFAAFFEPLKEEVALKRNIAIGATELSGRVELIEREGPKVRQALADL